MSWTEVKRFYGFSKPYRFNVAIPAMLNAAFLLLVIIKFVGALINNNNARIYGPTERNFLTFPSEMFFFYLYMIVGFILLNLFITKPKLYWPLFVWFLVEFCLGVWGKGLAPFDSRTEVENRFDYHPLLQGAPAPNFKGQKDGILFAHNSLGLRDTNNSVDVTTRDGLVVVFGGSTTYDIGVSQGETWVEELNGFLGPSYKLFNFGVDGYNTSQHVLQTAFYSDINGIYPSCALYYVGWNDIRLAHIADLDRGFADFHLLNLLGAFRTRRAMRIATVSPLLKLAVRGVSNYVDTPPTPRLEFDDSPEGKDNLRLKATFQRNISTIAAINVARGTKTIFVGQILNRDYGSKKSNDDFGRGWLPFVRDRDAWPLQAEFNGLLNKDAVKDGYTYIDADVSKFDAADFVDSGHFSPPGAKKFASLIAEGVRQACPASQASQ